MCMFVQREYNSKSVRENMDFTSLLKSEKSLLCCVGDMDKFTLTSLYRKFSLLDI